VVFNLLQQLEALGLNLPAVMQQLGVQTPPPNSPARRPPEPSPPPRPDSLDRRWQGRGLGGSRVRGFEIRV